MSANVVRRVIKTLAADGLATLAIAGASLFALFPWWLVK